MTRLFSESVTGLVAYGNGAFIFARKELIMEAYDKPFLTYDEQIDCLIEKHGLDVSDRDFARRVLRSVSYYDLINGYKDAFMVNEKYGEHMSIEFLYSFYIFDKRFQDLLFAQILLVENTFKTELAYVIARDFGASIDEYLDYRNYRPGNGKSSFQAIKRNIYNGVSINNPSKAPQPSKHYLEHHNHLPPWILFKNVSFRNIINLGRLLKPKQKEYILESLLPNVDLSITDRVNFLINGLNLMRKCRNQIAHTLKFLSFHEDRNRLSASILTKILPPCLVTWRDIKKGKRGLYDLDAVLNLSLYFVSNYNPHITRKFCDDLRSLFTPKDNSRNEVMKKALFDSYAHAANLPMSLPDRLEVFHDCLRDK